MSAVGDPMKSVEDKIRGFVPSKFNAVITRPCRKTFRVAIDLEGYPRQKAVKKAMKNKSEILSGASLQPTKKGCVLVISGAHDQIVNMMKACKEEILAA